MFSLYGLRSNKPEDNVHCVTRLFWLEAEDIEEHS